ncbi:MAG: AraC family transcriptional regulator [Planctomycetes bacterium]|nr:AraC family transcriptional regulator [Planctomycetota bacterium]
MPAGIGPGSPASVARPLPATLISGGLELRDQPGYDWHGLRRGEAEWALLQLTLDGEGLLTWEGEDLRVPAGAAMLLTIPHDHRYRLPPGGRWRHCYLCLGGREVLLAARAAIARHGPLLRPAPDGALLQALAAGVAGVQAGGLTAWKASALAYAVAMALGELAGGDPATRPEPLQRAAAWALARLDATLAVDDLAARAGLSPAHFARAFAAAYGLPPMAWINGQRLDRAARLLTGGDLPVAEVGRRCGFAEPSYFCRVFRRAYALTPAGYRATVR